MPVIRNVLIWDSARANAVQGDVVTGENGRIEDIVPAKTSRDSLLYDGGGRTLAIPGLVNAHTHVSMTLLRGLGEELPLMEWLQNRIFPAEERLNPRHIRVGAELALLEMIASGTTCFADMYFFMREVAASALNAGMRAALCRGITGGDAAKLNENLSLAEEFDGREGRICVQLGPHAPYTVPRAFLEKIVETARERDLGIHFHWLETEGELEGFRNELRIEPAEYLRRTGLLDVKRLLLAHSVWFPAKELPSVCLDNVTLVHNPKSNLKLGSGYAPVREMLENGVNVALGTDGAASNNRLDMWDEMRTAALMHKGYHRNPTLVSARDALRMATTGGARGLGFPDAGLIEPGYWADVVLIDIDQPHYLGIDETNVPEFLVYAGSSRDVKATVVSGQMLYKNGEYLTLDRDDILARAKEARKEITRS